VYHSAQYDEVQPVAMAKIRHLVLLVVVLRSSCGSSDLEKMLIEAALYGDVDKISLLIERGANVNGIALDGWTPLSRAADAGQSERLRSVGLTEIECA
jgi:ankyrin repeat protein